MIAFIRRILPRSLKIRLIVVLLLVAVIPLSLIGISSYYTIHLLLENKVEKGIVNSLEQETKGLDATLTNMDYASQQLALFKGLREYFLKFISQTDALERSEIEKQVYAYTTIVNYTNPDLGLMTYYLPDTSQYLFSNMNVKSDMRIESFPQIYKPYVNLQFQGPHRTLYPYSENRVLSVLRTLESKENEPKLAVYIETNFKVFQDKIISEPYGVPVKHLLINSDSQIVYSEKSGLFPEGSSFEIKETQPGKSYYVYGSSYVFLEKSKWGWSLATVVEMSDFNREQREWLIRFFSISVISIGLSLLLAWLVWRMIYRPLAKLQLYIRYTASNRLDEHVKATGVPEFDGLLDTYRYMNGEIRNLLSEVREKERNKRKLEVEKLLYQINPHFIHNTLNTVQWLAKMNGQQQIFQLVSHFIEVLDYNLGKEGKIVTIQQEIKALQDYISLQQIRYQYAFHVDYDLEEEALNIPFPRFLLQPLVENALYHGFKTKDGQICVRVKREPDGHVLVQVQDNGEGMTPEKIRQLFEETSGAMKKVGLGIGLQFVQNTIHAFYGEPYCLEITSQLGAGTTMSLRLPAEIGGEAHD